MDWGLFHVVNAGVAARDWLEDPFTLVAAVLVPLYALATVGLWFLSRPGGDRRPKTASVSALLAAAVAMATNQVISHLWDRPRPSEAHPLGTHLLSAASPDPSFPSDHAAAAFAIAFAVFAVWRRAGVVFLAAATLIAVSRIALGMHYPSDVAAGAVVGLLAAWLVTGSAVRLVWWIVRRASMLTDPLVRPVWRLVDRSRALGTTRASRAR